MALEKYLLVVLMLARSAAPQLRQSPCGLFGCWILALALHGNLFAAEKPNVLIILADDLGYSDLGCYGGEIHTPNLDELSNHGLRFTQFHNTARCWPTRAALLTGYYAQQVRRDSLPGGKRGNRPNWARLLPDMLKPLGYRSYHSGKWHLDGKQLEAGFDHSYNLADQGRFFSPQRHYQDDQKLPPVEPGSGYYATTAIADHAIQCLQKHAEEHADQPFFHYLAFTAPHFPLHALPEDIARYRDTYRHGWKSVREQRWQRIQKLGLLDGTLSAVEREVGPPYPFPDAIKTLGPGEVNRPLPWDDLTKEQREFQATKMALHAAMVDRMDQEIGRVLDQLRTMNTLENTLLFFLSDNGASAEIMVRNDGHDPSAEPGSAATHLCLGPGWSTTSNTPFRRHKTWVHQGGIATPLIVHWPQGIAAHGELRRNVGHVIDLVPTILDAAGGKPLKTWDGQPVPPPPGLSLVPVFAQDRTVMHEYLWWYHEGNRALRSGKWKLVAAGEKGPWELYDLNADPTETKNLVAQFPDKARKLEQTWTQHTNEFRKIALADQPNPKAAEAKTPIKELILPGKAFRVEGRPAFIFLPPKENLVKPRPWIFYSPTLPGYPDVHEKWMHQQFLAAGVAVAGIDVGEAYGSPKSRELLTAFYREMTDKRGYATKPCMLGRSRGGLWASSWAIEHPNYVAGLAGIYPVFDLQTYPGLEKAAPAYELSSQQLKAQRAQLNPIERIHVLAKARIPAFFIHGKIDRVVPIKENSAAFVKRYQAEGAGSLVKLLVVPDQGHNHWPGFFHCQSLIDFTIAQARNAADKQKELANSKQP